MLTIRFNRIGKKNKAYFRLVVQEHTIAPGGGHVEILGSYNPHLKKESLKAERIKYWVEKGVTFSDTAYNFLVSKGLVKGAKRTVKFPKKPASNVSDSVASGVEAPVAALKPAEIKAKAAEAPKEEVKKEEEKKPEIKEETKAADKPEVSEKKLETKKDVKTKVDPVK